MWFDGVIFRIIFIILIFLSYQDFVECDINCHEDDKNSCQKTSGMFKLAINKYRVKHGARNLQRYHPRFCHITVKQAKSLALSGNIMKNDPDYNPMHQYSNTFGHVEGILYENNGGKNIAQDIVKRWYEEKNNYNGKSYSPKIANFTRMLWNESDVNTCAICSKGINTHYIVCAFKLYEPSDNRNPSAKQFKKNVFFINDPSTAGTTIIKKETTRYSSTIKKTTTRYSLTFQKQTTTYSSINKKVEKETTTEWPGSSTPYHYRSPTPCPLMKTLLAGIIYMTAVLGIIPIIILLIIIYQRRW